MSAGSGKPAVLTRFPPALARLSLLSSRRRLVAWEPLSALLLVAGVFGLIQLASPDIVGVDGYYHIKVAVLIREHGPRLDFPWLRFTILNRDSYTDHHLLFHILQTPLTVLEPLVAAKLAAVVFATLALWCCYLFMARGGVRWPLAWLLLLLAVAPTFLWRQSMARPQSLALLLLVGALWLIFEQRLIWLAPLGFLSAWLFDGFVLTFVVPFAALIAGLLVERRLEWRPLAYLALGTGLGLVLHPYFPRNVEFAALHLLPKGGLGIEDEVRVGLEWSPYAPSTFLRQVGPALAVMLVGMAPILVQLWRQQPPARAPLTLLLVTLGFLALQVRSQRIVEYFPAFAVLLAAWGWSSSPPRLPPRLDGLLARGRIVLVALAFALLAVWLGRTVVAARSAAVSNTIFSAQAENYRGAARWLAANSPPGSVVFNVDWDDFPQLFFWNSHNVYVVGLDPTYLSLYDPELYRLWSEIASGALPLPAAALRERFGAAYVFSDTRHGRFLSRAAGDPGLEEVFRSPAAVVFRVRPAAS